MIRQAVDAVASRTSFPSRSSPSANAMHEPPLTTRPYARTSPVLAMIARMKLILSSTEV
jgi:hypothetical protein